MRLLTKRPKCQMDNECITKMIFFKSEVKQKTEQKKKKRKKKKNSSPKKES